MVVLALLAMSCGSTPQPTANATADRSASIEWHSFGPSVFETAQEQRKMVLLDVGIEGCTACRWMLEDTYQDPRVVSRVREHFLADPGEVATVALRFAVVDAPERCP